MKSEIQAQRPRPELAEKWRILLAATVGCGLGATSLLAASFGTFIIPLGKEFGWSRGEISSALLFMTGALAFSSPLLGLLMDRYGVRRVALNSIPLLAAAFAGLTLMSGSLLFFYLCFALATLLGGGTAPISYSRAVNQAFHRSRGLALGIMFSGMGVAAALLPLASAAIIAGVGWRWSFAMLGLLAVVAFPFVFVGLPRHGVVRASEPGPAPCKRSGAFLRSRIFWTIAATCSCASLASYGLLVHFVPLLNDAGMTAGEAARYAALIGVASIAGRVVIGFLLDRLFAPIIGSVVLAATAAGCVIFSYVGLPAAGLMAILIGFSFGMEVDLLSFLIARYFGMKHYGVIYGTIYSCFAISAAIGPAVDGFIYDATGSYIFALWGTAGLLLASAIFMLTLPQYASEADDRTT